MPAVFLFRAGGGPAGKVALLAGGCAPPSFRGCWLGGCWVPALLTLSGGGGPRDAGRAADLVGTGGGGRTFSPRDAGGVSAFATAGGPVCCRAKQVSAWQ